LRRAVFLDRDGVVVADDGLIVSAEQLRVVDGAIGALSRLACAGWVLVVVTNQAVVARGLVDEASVHAIHESLQAIILSAGGPVLDGFWVCPHHPHAQVARYRLACSCRKPRPGLILSAANKLGLDPSASWMIGDRSSDIAAGRRAGCRTILVASGRHLDAPIFGSEDLAAEATPHFEVSDLAAAARIIVGDRS